MSDINEKNGLHVNVDPAAGGQYAGPGWIPVPEDGVPADLRDEVGRWCNVRNARPERAYSVGMLTVTDLTWDAVRAAIAAQHAEAEKQHATRLAAWRVEAAQYLQGLEPTGYFCLNPRKLTEAIQVSDAEIEAVAVEARRREDVARAQKRAVEAEREAKLQAWIARLVQALDSFDMDAIVDFSVLQAIWDEPGVPPRPKMIPPQEIANRFYACAKRAEEKAEAERAAKRTLFLQGVTTWIAEHGSERLKLAVAAGEVGNCLGVYYTERRDLDCGAGWEFYKTSIDIQERINPTTAELAALLAQRQINPKAQLGYVRLHGHTDDCGDMHDACVEPEHAYRPALLSLTPFDAWGSNQTLVKKCIIKFF